MQIAQWLGLLAASSAVTGVLTYWMGRRRLAALSDQHRRLQRQAAENEELLRSYALGAVLIRTLDGTITHWSAGCEALFGFAAGAALGRKVQELLSTRFPPGGLRTVQEELVRRGEWRGELRHRQRSGDALVVASHWALRRDPLSQAPVGVVELHADASMLKAAEEALRAEEARLLLAQEVAGVGIWEWDPGTDLFAWTPEQYGLSRDPAAPPTERSLEAFLTCVHPDDRGRIREATRQALATGEYDVEFRLLRSTQDKAWEARWLSGRGRRMPAPAGKLGPILGIHMDITQRKEAEARQELLMREVDHRAKNALAVVQAVLRLTKAETPEAFGQAIAGRVSALARAHTLLTKSQWAGASLTTLIRGELAPFVPSTAMPRVSLSGPELTVAPVVAQPLSMMLHELATNAAKYGSLSVPDGTLQLSWSVDSDADRLMLQWTERGGPPVTGTGFAEGFGSRMIRATIQDQLGGTVQLNWQPDGLICSVVLPMRRSLTRSIAKTNDS